MNSAISDNDQSRGSVQTNRRTFLRGGLALGAGSLAAGLLPVGLQTVAAQGRFGLPPGDVAILRFLAAVEILETDLWQQYNELTGIQDNEVPGGTGNPDFTEAVNALDEDMNQYVHDNTEDEISHALFINAYLQSRGVEPLSLEHFRTLPSSQATGAVKDAKRLTNLMQLTLDTSWYTRYRSRTKNPDLGDTFPQAIPDLANGKFPAIPRNDDDLEPGDHLQAIANTAGFHFATIEQAGSSLYPTLAQNVTDPEVLRILLSIGPTETMHFQTWQDKAGNAPALTDPTNGLTFPDLNADPFGGEDFSTNLILPEPTFFLNRSLPAVSVIRPTTPRGGSGAVATVRGLVSSGLFLGQTPQFLGLMLALAASADGARRGIS